MASDRGGPGRYACGLVGCLLVQAVLAGVAGAEDETPDLELLAYLGSWAGTDEEWIAIAEWDGKTEDSAPAEPAPSEETEDE